MQTLLSVGLDTKTIKGEKYGFITGIVYLAPSLESGINTCPDASPECKKLCLFTAGKGGVRPVHEARVKKTVSFFSEKRAFLGKLIEEIAALVRKAIKEGKTPAVRLNGTSDLPWERVRLDGKSLMEIFPAVQFYDYTKSESRMFSFLLGRMPSNYHLTFSRSENNQTSCARVLALKGNVAAVFSKMPKRYLGARVVSGEDSDLRFLDPKGVVVGLTPKGKAKKSNGGFVV